MSNLQTLIKTYDTLAEQNTKLNPVLDCELYFGNLSTMARLRIQIDQEAKAMLGSLVNGTFVRTEQGNEELVANCLALCSQDRKKAKECYIEITLGTSAVSGDGANAWVLLPNGRKGILPLPMEPSAIMPYVRRLLRQLWEQTLKTLAQ